MKTFLIQKAALLVAFCAILSNTPLFAQVTATISFENLSPATFGGTPYTKAFSSQTGGLNFLATGRFKMQGGGAGPTYYGANSSPYFMDSGDDTGPAVNSANIGGFVIQNSATAFKVNSFAAYTASDKGGNNKVTSNVTFIGTKVDNTTVTGVVTITPTNTGSFVQNGLTFTGTALNNVYFTKLEISLPSGTQYLELDDINVTTQAVTINQFSINDVSLTEGNSGTKNFTFTVTRTDNTTASSVQVQSANGTATAGSDYVAFPLTTLNFTVGGALTQTVTVLVNGDVTVEPDETFTMTLSNPSSGSVLLDATGTGTIIDDDAIKEDFEGETGGGTTFSQSGFNFTSTGGQIVRQGSGFGSGGSAGYLSNNAPGNTGNVGGFQLTNTGTSFNVLSVDLWTANTSGTPPNYVYTPATASVTITGTKADGTGTVAVTVSVATTGNPFVVVDLTGTALNGVQLTALSFSISGATFLEIDNFRFGTSVISNTQLSINDVSVLEGTGGGVTTAVFTVTRTNNTTAFTVNVASSNGTATAGSDYTAFPSTTLTFTNGGALSQTVSVNIIHDASIEPNETFNMTLSGATNGTLYFKQIGIGTILDDDQVIETFEDETSNATSFTQNSIAFTATGGYKVTGGVGSTFGAGSSGFFLTSANNVVGSMGTFSVSTPNTAFKINSLDGWVGTSQGAFSSGTVTFTGTLFGGGTVSTNKTITATSNTGAGWQQNITFTGTPLNNVLLTAIQVTTTGSLKACDIDNFNYVAVNTLPIIEVTDASNVAITNGGAAATTNNTDFGNTCVTGGTVSKTYTIKNTGGANLTLSGSPLAVLGGANASEFSVTLQPTSPVAASGSTTLTVVFDPTSAGAKSATVTLTNNDATNSPYIINIAATGNADPTITTSASAAICTGATSFTIPYTATTGTPTTYSISGTGITSVTNGALPATPITVNLSSGASGSSISYTLTVRNANTCTSNPATMGSVTVNTTSAPTAPMATPSGVVSGNTTTLTASGCTGGTLIWYDAANPTVALPNNMPTITSSRTFFARCTGSNSCVSVPSSNVTASVVLPVELMRFEGKNTEGGNLLTWTTASEINNKGFDIERSTANGDWETLGFVKGKGQASTYQFTDKSPSNTSYYRLRQIDNDGKETLSKVISIQIKGNDRKLKAYPNPVSDVLTIETEATGDYQIINILGQIILRGPVSLQRIDVSTLSQGNYVLKIGVEQVKFVKQ